MPGCECINCEHRRGVRTNAIIERMRSLNIWPYNRVEK